MKNEENKLFTTQNIIRMGLLSAVAVILMQFDLALPMLFPPFLKIDLGDVPAIIGILMVHPLAGLLIPLLKNLMDVLIFGTTTGAVGEASNFIVSVAYMLPLMIVARKNKGLKAVLISLMVGIVSATIAGSISNYFVVLPVYSKLIPLDQIIQMGSHIVPVIDDLKSFVIFIIAPFNVFKSTIVSIASVVVVKAVLPAMKVLTSRQA